MAVETLAFVAVAGAAGPVVAAVEGAGGGAVTTISQRLRKRTWTKALMNVSSHSEKPEGGASAVGGANAVAGEGYGTRGRKGGGGVSARISALPGIFLWCSSFHRR